VPAEREIEVGEAKRKMDVAIRSVLELAEKDITPKELAEGVSTELGRKVWSHDVENSLRRQELQIK
jgi:hypothetical protein